MLFCRCWSVCTKVPWCGSADRVLLPTKKAFVVYAETRASGERGTWTLSDSHNQIVNIVIWDKVFMLLYYVAFLLNKHFKCVFYLFIYFYQTLFFYHLRMFRNYVMSYNEKNCWFKSIWPNSITGSRYLKMLVFNNANPLTFLHLDHWPFWSRPLPVCLRPL